MASRQEMEYTYSLMDQIFRLSIGERGDFSGAMYDGDFSLSLEEAQDKKHRFIADMLKVRKGTRILDMGCGWGPLLAFFSDVGAEAKGLTLSGAQAASCRRAGFDVEIMDCRAIRPETFGQFDAITSVGAFEHFCSVEEWQQGKQDAIYGSFFRTVADLLPVGGRLFLQTMVFGRNMIDYPRIDIRAERGSTPYVLAVMRRQFPRLLASLRKRADRKERAAVVSDRLQGKRQAGLHRDYPPVGNALSALQSEEICVLSFPGSPLPCAPRPAATSLP